MFKELFALSLLGAASVQGASMKADPCAPTPPATCYPDDCRHCYCLGPENYGVNPSVCPKTCNGDFIIKVAGLYWNSHQDGMEYVIKSDVRLPDTPLQANQILSLNNLIDGKYYNPDFNWDFGFKIGLGYCTTCDGWDVGVNWTWYRGKGFDHQETVLDDNQSLLPLWSAFSNFQGSILYATDAQASWRWFLNLVDIELGRNFWTSKYLAVRPHVGFRVAFIKQTYKLNYRGGAWGEIPLSTPLPALVDFVKLKNDFHGVGLRGGLDTEWNLGCGWALFGNWAVSIVYGRFSVEHEEKVLSTDYPHNKTDILETSHSLRASPAMLDLDIGIQWSTMFCDCKYGFTAMIGWEHHLFFDQNQLWRIVRTGDTSSQLPNNTGKNVFYQRRGDLDTQGFTLSLKLEF